MKKLVIFVGIFVVISAGYELGQYLRPMTEAFEAYQLEGERMYRAGGLNSSGHVKGTVLRVSYQFESSSRLDSDRVRFEAMQSVQFQRPGEAGIGSREVAKTRQRVIMQRTVEGWQIDSIEEEETELVRLEDLDLLER